MKRTTGWLAAIGVCAVVLIAIRHGVGSVRTAEILHYEAQSRYEPWSASQLYDTSLPGRSNRGHEREFDGLNAPRQRALIEYLKRL